jgi:5-hydroxyisourate hydrolase
MPGVSIHVVDVSRGLVATGMRVELLRLDPAHAICDDVVGRSGAVEAAALAGRFERGSYEARFHVAGYFRAAGIALPGVPFLDVAVFRFGIDDPEQHYHLPMKLTPWGLSCFRGGA